MYKAAVEPALQQISFIIQLNSESVPKYGEPDARALNSRRFYAAYS
jgi:hypothetical protein